MADLTWDFETADPRPGGQGGVYGYVFPSSQSPGQTPRHQARLTRPVSGASAVAKLSFTLDGEEFPGTGLGLMFEDALPLDLRPLDSIQVRIRADRFRKIRLSLAPADSALKLIADEGVSLGRDTVVGPKWVIWKISARDISWPRWATSIPSTSREDILSQIFAIQFDVSCDAKGGVCTQDSGWLELDDLHLFGVGGAWPEPPVGDCSPPALSIDRFQTGLPNQNDLGGWWYAYTDRTSADSFSRGKSQVLNASSPDSANTWVGPDSLASLRVMLERQGVYSGYAAIETQLSEPEGVLPTARSFPGMGALSFDVAFDSSFPKELGGLIVHLRKRGADFEGGRDHQVRIPWQPTRKSWCLDFSSFQQPTWSEWIEPFTPDSLMALSFEVRLPAIRERAEAGFSIGNIAFHSRGDVGVGPRDAAHRLRAVSSPRGWVVEWSRESRGPAPWRVLDLRGRTLLSGTAPQATHRLEIPNVSDQMVVLVLMLPEGARSLPLIPSR